MLAMSKMQTTPTTQAMSIIQTAPAMMRVMSTTQVTPVTTQTTLAMQTTTVTTITGMGRTAANIHSTAATRSINGTMMTIKRHLTKTANRQKRKAD